MQQSSSSSFAAFLRRWFITTLAVLVAANVVSGIHYTPGGLIVASLLLGILNAFVRPILLVLSLPLLIFTLGFFIIIINALLFYWVGHLKNFRVDDFWTALLGSLIVSVVSILLNFLTGGNSRVKDNRPPPPPPPPPRSPPERDKSQGPIIDV